MDAPTQKPRLEPIDYGRQRGRNGAQGLQSPVSSNNLNSIGDTALIGGLDFDNYEGIGRENALPSGQNSKNGLERGVPETHQYLNKAFENLLGGDQQAEMDENTM